MGGYKCTSIGCYSYQSPETNTLFQKLQTVTNQFASALAFDPLKVDGIIGKGSTEAVLLVLVYLGETDKGPVGASARALEAGIASPETLVANAQAVVDTLTLATKQSAIAAQTTAPAQLPPSSPEPTATQKATTTANAPTSSTNPAVQQKIQAIKATKPALSTSIIDRLPPWAAYASGAALVLGAIAAIGYAVRKRQGSPSVPSAPPVAGFLGAGSKMNEWGLTWYRWWRAAGFTRAPSSSSEAYRAWRAGEDPSDWRATA